MAAATYYRAHPQDCRFPLPKFPRQSQNPKDMAAMSTGNKLAIAGVVVAGVTAYMAYLGASSSWQYYMTVPECVENAHQVAGQRIRVSGSIVPGSLTISPDRQEAHFSLSESGSQIPVVCKGPLPDDLSATKTMDVVVEGRLEESCMLEGDKLITRCASKYNAQKKEPTATADLRGTQHPGAGSGEIVR
jgi:cytochrome c-type biogenesis protein CcmE